MVKIKQNKNKSRFALKIAYVLYFLWIILGYWSGILKNISVQSHTRFSIFLSNDIIIHDESRNVRWSTGRFIHNWSNFYHEMYKEQCYSQWNINCKSSKDLEGCSLNFDIMFKPHRIKLRRILCILILQMPSKIHRHKASGHR